MKFVWKEYDFVFAAVLLLSLSLAIPNQIMGLAVTAILAFYTFLKPKNGILLLLIYFPSRSFLTEINPGLKLAGDLIIVVAFLKVALHLLMQKDWKRLFDFSIWELAFFGFLIVGSISALLTGVSIGAIIFQIRAFFITYLLFYSVKRLDITKDDIHKFVLVTFITALLLTIQGLVEKISLRTMLMPDTWVNRRLSPVNAGRIYGFLNNPNTMAVYLSFALVITFYLKKFSTGKLLWLVNTGLVLMAGAFTLTYSRGAWIAFGFGLLGYLFLGQNWKFLRTFLITFILAIVLVNIPATQLAEYMKTTDLGKVERTGPVEDDQSLMEHERLKKTFELSTIELSQATGRLYIINKGFEIFKDHPIIGTGFGTFGDSATKSYSSPIYEKYGIWFDIYSDNQYIQIITQTGSIGVILFAIFLLGMLVVFWKNRSVPFAVTMFAALLGIYASSMFNNVWEDKTSTMYYFILFGAFVAQIRNKESQKA